MRKKIVAGNWKMNNNRTEAGILLSDLKSKLPTDPEVDIIVAPTFIELEHAVTTLKGSQITVAAQNMHQAEKGAYTGEVSSDMLTRIGVNTVILGHSERRMYFGETDTALAAKVDVALASDMTVIFCFGETLEDRKKDTHFEIIETQLKNALFHLDASQWNHIVLAYEPVWAIGTGETASPEQAQEMHAFIRKTIANSYNAVIAEKVSILYGGSVNAENAKAIFAKADVDGGLIGGASLDAEAFTTIAKALLS